MASCYNRGAIFYLSHIKVYAKLMLILLVLMYNITGLIVRPIKHKFNIVF